jgi:hypothetical protein
LNALRSIRTHELQPQGSERTSYCSHFELDGWLAPLTRTLLGRRLAWGFGAMAQALKERAELLHRESRGHVDPSFAEIQPRS